MKIEDFTPISDRVLVRIQFNDKTAGGLYVPDVAKERGQFAKVLKVGPGRTSYHTHKLMPMDVKEGDVILIGKHTGWKMDESEDLNLRMIHNTDILGIIE